MSTLKPVDNLPRLGPKILNQNSSARVRIVESTHYPIRFNDNTLYISETNLREQNEQTKT